MASSDYYQNSSQQYQPYSYSDPYHSAPDQRNDYAEHPQRAPSAAPTYHTNDISDERLSQSQSHSPHSNTYTDYRPSKDPPRLQTSQWTSTQNTAYPPSPESQRPNPPLLSSPTSPKRKKRKRKGGWFRGKVPWFVYIMTLIQVTVFIAEIIKNAIITGSPIMIKPAFNPMIGPSTYVLINMGARFVPCMRTTYFPGTQDPYPTTGWPCPRSTSNDPNDPSNQCSLAELCGLGGLDADSPNQWYRFIVPMFLHAGIIHIGFNMLLQMTLGRDLERQIGTLRFAIVYFSSGIFGFVLGGNFAAPAIASTGASGCLFGIFALLLLDLFYTWSERESPVKDLLWILFDIVISFVLGLLPGLDNFSHIGGFLMGLVLGICILHSPNRLRRRLGETSHKTTYSQISSESNIALTSGALRDNDKNDSPTAAMGSTEPTDLTKFAKHPVGFFKNRKPAWWIWWVIRAGCLIGVLVGFIVLLANFYQYRDECKWCKYLSCLDITVNGQNWCDVGYITFTNQTSSNSGGTKRALAALVALMDNREA